MINEKRADAAEAEASTQPLLEQTVAMPVPRADAFSGLTARDAGILREQVFVPQIATSLLSVYRYANLRDRLYLSAGLFFGIAEGTVKALMPLAFGAFAAVFAQFAASTDPSDYYYISPDDFQRLANQFALYFLYIGIAEFVLSWIATFIFIDAGETISSRIREAYLRSTLRQNIGYFDNLGSGEITNRISSDTVLIQEGISEKLIYIVENFTTLIASVVVGLTQSWKLTLIMSTIIVFIAASFIIASRLMTKFFNNALNGASAGGSIAEEVIGSIRNVHAFNIQERLSEKYSAFLEISQIWALRAGITVGSVTGIMWLSVYSDDALGFWQGARLVARGEISVRAAVTVLAAVVEGTFAVSNVTPHVKSISTAVAAINKIFTTIDRQSAIDSCSDEGLTLNQVKGDISLKDVRFIYPSRPDYTVLDKYSLDIKAGTTVALVGASGSGKSTIVGILERFYKPLAGSVTLDGYEIDSLNIKWLRRQIALVSQEPTLFACTIYQNIAYGLIGTPYEFANETVKRDLIMEACRQANALMFIENLPEGLDTNVGERGFLLSGGQKQRIAIARAIVSNPKILLLDEATSALDTKSEGVVQEALDRASKNRTTIVIAHRLSTIKDADNIVVMRRGAILEQGTHNDLLAARGEYYDLVKAQSMQTAVEQQKAAIKSDAGNPEEDLPVEEALDREAHEVLELSKTITRVPTHHYDDQSEHQYDQYSDDESQVLMGEHAKKEYSLRERFAFIFELSKEEEKYNILGAIFSTIQGLGYPSLGLFYGRCIEAYGLTNFDDMIRQIDLFAGLFFMLATVELVASITALSLYAFSGQRLVRRIRIKTLKHILRQDISFFDKDENSTGALTNTLAQDAQAVDGLSGATLGQIMNSISIVSSSIILSLIIAWQLALVCTACVPVLIGSGFYRCYVLTKFQEDAKVSQASSANFACEAVSGIKTVASLTREEEILEAYHQTLAQTLKKRRTQSNQSAFWFGLAQGMTYWIMSLAFWFGSLYIRTREYSVFQFYVAFMSIVYGAQSAGIAFSYAPDMGKAYHAVGSIKALFEIMPTIDATRTDGDVPQNVEGDIEFSNVFFRYPTRMGVPVLNGLNLKIKKGQYVALVGASGCGKSTTIGLIESFYRPQSGTVMLDGHDISKFNINAYRSHIALVSQEPTLYSGTVRENVALGSLVPVTDEQIQEACRKANIHDFVMSLPDGYDTLCGSKGSLFSGGQKQRIAIARALIREPKVLLLDEATSALDNESEKVVQAALDAASKGRTTVAIAHRLSSIKNADVIYVFDNGKVLESGTHAELMARKSKYYELVQLQSLENAA
ncbi:P-loop containing nucleoside triphosphate hydrolase protein [Dipodascopsis tothii]|uniref:P-loop containing nucleoside triphosphate hydrolase protein n=1 Tax=Dipodascopsis tothii TaxID=44089 RepID=UPI0034CF4629